MITDSYSTHLAPYYRFQAGLPYLDQFIPVHQFKNHTVMRFDDDFLMKFLIFFCFEMKIFLIYKNLLSSRQKRGCANYFY